ncbi:hypothetical protein ACFV8Z_37545 [Streptomyces sp. NPDC059837]|uniref:hypothetical protein n=1 Tax=unclassified Streptomyces TaxID=2593676 RepID=UPI00224D19E3|nr:MULTISPECIES: hypothetical protein [unclassified Streptomyces]MCX4405338.1 hypothetical protein [Streptomyces sp. NBC_01764]MCX5190111.1 hypothetical protein [Streptomyces sp. NBC_00268]
MTDDETDLHKAARIVLPHVDELLDAAAAQRLRAALDAADDDAIVRLAESAPAVGDWLADYLDATSSELRAYDPLAGDAQPVAPSAVFRCPVGTLVWYRRFTGETPPRCPTHDVDLVRAEDEPSVP